LIVQGICQQDAKNRKLSACLCVISSLSPGFDPPPAGKALSPTSKRVEPECPAKYSRAGMAHFVSSQKSKHYAIR